ncbi:MAG: hypothetical protein ABW189_08155 [Rickettsiales bacterium]
MSFFPYGAEALPPFRLTAYHPKGASIIPDIKDNLFGCGRKALNRFARLFRVMAAIMFMISMVAACRIFFEKKVTESPYAHMGVFSAGILFAMQAFYMAVLLAFKPVKYVKNFLFRYALLESRANTTPKKLGVVCFGLLKMLVLVLAYVVASIIATIMFDVRFGLLFVFPALWTVILPCAYVFTIRTELMKAIERTRGRATLILFFNTGPSRHGQSCDFCAKGGIVERDVENNFPNPIPHPPSAYFSPETSEEKPRSSYGYAQPYAV